MPTIDGVMSASQTLSGADEILVSQLVSGSWVTRKTTITALLNLLGASSYFPPGILTGHGAPAPEIGIDPWSYIDADDGGLYQFASGTWTLIANLTGPQGERGDPEPTFLIADLEAAGAISQDTDKLAVSQGGTMVAATIAQVLNGRGIGDLLPANPASDTDAFFVSQGNDVLARQTMAGVWSLVLAHLPEWRRPVVELTGNTTLDGASHNQAILVCSGTLTVAPSITMGSGFSCDIVNVSGGDVTFDDRIRTSNASTTLPTGEAARVFAADYSGGTLYFASLSGGSGGLPPDPPGTVSDLSATATTYSSVTLGWTAPSSGGQVTSYSVAYQEDGDAGWTLAPGSPGSASTTAFTVTGLASVTTYSFRVIAQNSAGAGTAAVLEGVTTADAAAAPGAPTGVAAGSATATTMTVTWSAPVSGGLVSGYSVYFRLAGSGAWTLATSSLGAGSTSYQMTGLTASTSYNFYVAANSASSGSTASSSVTASTAASGGSYLLDEGSLAHTTGNPYTHGAGGSVPVNVDDNSTSGEGSHTVPANVFFVLSTSNSVEPTTGLVAATGSSTGIPGGGGRNLWYQWLTIPSSAGTYYLWSIAKNGGGDTVETFVSPSAVTVV